MAEVQGNKWGGPPELALCLRGLGVAVGVIQASLVTARSTPQRAVEFVQAWQPGQPKFVVVAVHVDKSHWDLGVVSLPTGGWTALLPFGSWWVGCKKILDFLVRRGEQNLQKWQRPGLEGKPHTVRHSCMIVCVFAFVCCMILVV